MKKRLWDRLRGEQTPAEPLQKSESPGKIKPMFRIVGWSVFALLLIWLILCRNILFTVSMFAILLVRQIFASRAGSRRLRQLRETYHRALREDTAFSVPKGRVLMDTFITMGPYLSVWVLSGMLIPLGGMSGWAVFAFPMLFLTGCVCSLLADTWKDLELGKWRYWGFFFLCYLISLLPGILMTVIP